MSTVKVLVAGGAGRMGQRIIALGLEDQRVEIIGALETSTSKQLGTSMESGKVIISDNPKSFAKTADVWIDFTAPEATIKHLKTAPAGTSFVIGTTGFKEAERKEIEAQSKHRAIVFSYNMSLGINLLVELVKQAAAKIGHYDIEILETHHNRKKDAPSGTAIMLANAISDELGRTSADWVHGREGAVGERKSKEIGIHAIRTGDVVGDHTVIFGTTGERLELTHKASSRDAFAKGALAAALWLKDKKAGLFTMKDVLGL